MKSKAIAGMMLLLNDECSRLNDGDWDKSKDKLIAVLNVLNAYDAIKKIKAEDVDHVRLERINGQGGALSRCGRSFAEHPDRCECQGDDPIPHRHYDYAPYRCARCGECKVYSPVASNSGG
jgi:hypothetical protein